MVRAESSERHLPSLFLTLPLPLLLPLPPLSVLSPSPNISRSRYAPWPFKYPEPIRVYDAFSPHTIPVPVPRIWLRIYVVGVAIETANGPSGAGCRAMLAKQPYKKTVVRIVVCPCPQNSILQEGEVARACR